MTRAAQPPAPVGADAHPPSRSRPRVNALRLAAARVRMGRRLGVDGRPAIGRRVRLAVAPGARLELGDGCVLGDGVRIQAVAGTVRIGPGAVIGEHAVLVALAGIEIGPGAGLGAQVLVADSAPSFDDVELPVRRQAVRGEPLQVGANARIGARAALLAGARVGAGAVVGSYAVVTGDVPAGAVAEGSPAAISRPPRLAAGRP